jgi:hypothetical protein
VAGDWRFILQGIDGSGTPGPILHPDLPLTGVNVTVALNATDELKGQLTPFSPALKDLLVEWGCCVWAEAGGKIRGGGILAHKEEVGSSLQLEFMGLHGYAHGMPYTSGTSYNGVEVDPLDVYRLIWSYLQSQPGGNLGLQFPSLKTGLKIGVELEQVEFDTEEGPVSFEAGPYQLNRWETHDLGDKIDDLAADTPFDFRERHEWSGNTIVHWMDLAYPRFNTRRSDVRFVVGENIPVQPTVTHAGDEYANELVVLGAGEGRTMIFGQASLPRGNRLRRVAVVEDKTIKSLTQANTRAYNELKARLEIGDITEFTVLDHELAPMGSVQPGDEVFISLDYDWQEGEGFWVRIQTIQYSPDQGNNYVLSVVRADKVA